jgi:hypothetical protein
MRFGISYSLRVRSCGFGLLYAGDCLNTGDIAAYLTHTCGIFQLACGTLETQIKLLRARMSLGFIASTFQCSFRRFRA